MSTNYQSICDEHGIYFLVLYRSNSSRIYNKINRPFDKDNNSLLEIKIAQLNNLNTNIIYSGDTNSFSRNCLSTYIERSNETVIDNSLPFSKVLMSTYDMIEKRYDNEVKHLLITYPTSPLFNETMYIKAIYEYYKNVIKGEHDSIMAGENKKGFFWYDKKSINYEANKNHKYTQDIEPVFECNNALWGGPFDVLKKAEYFIGNNPYMLSVPNLFSTDIDTHEDFKTAQILYDAYSKGQYNDIF